jgi:glycosyltransferase involved in cell wall biosynthesis
MNHRLAVGKSVMDNDIKARRVLHVVHSMAGGGAQRQLAYLASAQIVNGLDVHVALVKEGPFFPALQASGATLHRLQATGNYDLRLLTQLIDMIRSLQPAVVHTRLLLADVIGGMAAIVNDIPWILSERSSGEAYPLTPKNRLRVAIARGAAAIESNSASGALYWKSARPEIRRQVIPPGVPLDEIDRQPGIDLRSLRVPPMVPAILFAGQFEEVKNPMNVLLALQHLFRERRAVAIFCGAGSLESKLRSLAASLGIADQVRFPGFITNLWGWMKAADLFIAPAWLEGRPNAVMEAAACRCPLIVSDIRQHHEFLDKDSAMFIPPEDPGAIAAAIISTLDDPGSARRRAERAHQLVSGFTIQAMAEEVDRLYDSVIACREPRT